MRSVMGRMRSPRPAARTMAFISCLSRLGCAQHTRVRARQPWHELLFDEPRKIRELRVTLAGVAHIFERERQVLQISVLAIAIPEPREDAEHLDVPLHADEIEPAQEL